MSSEDSKPRSHSRIESAIVIVVWVAFVSGFVWIVLEEREAAAERASRCPRACAFTHAGEGKSFGNRCVCEDGSTPLKGWSP